MSLSEKRKGDRIKMAEAVKAKVLEKGSEASIITAPYGHTNCIRVDIKAPRGLRLSVELDGKSCQPDVHVLSWHMDHKVNTRLSSRFGDINTFHRRKSTDVAYGFDQLLFILDHRLEQCRQGVAYMADEG